MRSLKNGDPLTVAMCHTGHRLLSARLVRLVVGHCIPERRASDRQSDEAWHRRGGLEPLRHFLLIGTTSQDDAADIVPAAAPRRLNHALAILAAIEPFDLPDIWLDSGILHCADGLEH